MILFHLLVFSTKTPPYQVAAIVFYTKSCISLHRFRGLSGFHMSLSGSVSGGLNVLHMPLSGSVSGGLNVLHMPLSGFVSGGLNVLHIPLSGSVSGGLNVLHIPLSGSVSGGLNVLHMPLSGSVSGGLNVLHIPLPRFQHIAYTTFMVCVQWSQRVTYTASEISTYCIYHFPGPCPVVSTKNAESGPFLTKKWKNNIGFFSLIPK